ncbi:S9 family peptidase [Sphingomonas hylomeconis]|uniref:DPP IV N-terminal domain-containing protein n=1 Tax=Sphingomonas hylomeconis TaxID=1395958 RepID=A0ABV7SSI5_9SPHN|nr:DPP IV N-terminal domain-containing protein [Sphingomonas hylomeconis]
MAAFPLLIAAQLVAAPAPTLRAPVVAPAPAQMPIAARYRLADRYLNDIDKLVVDRDLRASFSRDGKQVIYRRGALGQRMIMLLDPAIGQPREIVAEDVLRELLAKAVGKPIKPGELSFRRPEVDATGALSFEAFDKRWTYQTGALRVADEQPDKDDEGLSPDGRLRVIARDYNLYAVPAKGGREVALTSDGTREQPYGRGIPQMDEILKQGTEEPTMPVSVRWSPDGSKILTWRLDTRGVHPLSFTQQNVPGSPYPRSFRYIYPLAGAAKLPTATRLVIDVAEALKRGKARIVPVQVPAEELLYPADPDMGWQGKRIRIQRTDRGYGALTVYDVDPATGAATVTAREAMKPIVTVTSSSLRPAPELGGELDISERSGWAQLYLVQPNAPDDALPLTRGDWEVLSVEHVDDARRSLLLTGIGREADRNPYWRGLYRVDLDGSQPKLLTPEPLDHDVTVSSDGRYAIDAMSSPTTPTVTVLRDARDGHIVTELGRADPTALYASGFTKPEPFQGVAADGKTPIYGMIFRPANFDPSRRYPVIDNVYTGPTTTQVPASWNAAIGVNPNSVAQLGAVVVTIDGRGTSRRGQAFRLPAYQNLGEVGIDDHIALIEQMAKRYPYMDTTRVGVYGGSAGGYDAARFILRRPKFFKVAVASSGNHDLRLDKAWWPEVSMGNPAPEVWERNSNMSVAGNLEGKLLLIHGDIDDNVPVTESMHLANALIRAERDVDLVILPNTTHRVSQPFFWKKFRDYFTRNLLDEAPPPLPPVAPAPAPAAQSQ